MPDQTPPDPLEAALSASAGVDDDRWRSIRKRLAARAADDGLLDVAYEIHESPFGELVVAATPRGLVRIALSAESQERVLEDLAERLSPRILRAGRDQIRSSREQLDQYFSGRRHRFELELDWSLSKGFRRQVLLATDGIPYGQTRSYRDVATEAGSPAAVRAAGTALATNPLPIVVPCHRVLRSDGQVGSYLGGSEMKRSLLDMEAELR